jgi:hypothetical protein
MPLAIRLAPNMRNNTVMTAALWAASQPLIVGCPVGPLVHVVTAFEFADERLGEQLDSLQPL